MKRLTITILALGGNSGQVHDRISMIGKVSIDAFTITITEPTGIIHHYPTGITIIKEENQ